MKRLLGKIGGVAGLYEMFDGAPALHSKNTTPAQIDIWRSAKSETEHLEFKEAKNQFDFEKLLGYCVAIANERGGLLFLGIANKFPRPVKGTTAYPNIVKTTEDLFNKLTFRVDIEEVQHPDGRVLVFHIPSRPTGRPYHLNGAYLMRSGESLVPMSPDQLEKIFSERLSARPTALYVTLLLIFGLAIVLTATKYWPSHNPNQRDAGTKSGETDAAQQPKDTGERKPKDVPPSGVIHPSESLADVVASLVNPSKLGITSTNTSHELAWDVRYESALWNLDEERNQGAPEKVLSLPHFGETYKGEYMKPGDSMYPRSLLDELQKSGRVKKGDRLVGYASVGCSNCPRTHSYWIYYVYETSGWYSLIPNGKRPALDIFSKNIPAISQSPEYFFRDVSATDRKSILDFHSN